MNTITFYKCLTSTALLGLLIAPNASYAQTDEMNKSQSPQQEVTIDARQGLMGYYYNDNNFKEPVLIAPEVNGDLKIEKSEIKDLVQEDKQNIQSVRWIGYIKPSKTAEYLLSTSSDERVIMQLDDQIVINQTKMTKKVKLEKDKLYQVKIEYRPETKMSSNNLVELQLYWNNSPETTELIPTENLMLPDFSPEEINNSFIPKQNLFESNTNNKVQKRSLKASEDDEYTDTDDDSIYDSWEENGYTVQQKMAVKWDESMKDKGYKKYVSNPYESHTVGDPYTDFEKASGDMDRGVKAEARNPLVAAYPVVGVGMEKMIISEFNEVTKEKGESVSTETSNSNTEENTSGIEASVGFDGLSINGQVTTSFSHTSSNTTTVENSSEKDWSEAIGMNKGESAALNANVRYYNTGTAPIYDAQPTTNLILGTDTLHTIRVRQNQIANTLAPGKSYPEKGLGPIALDQLDDEGTNIFMNYDQLRKIQNGEKLKLETMQTSGLYGIKDVDGSIKKDSSQEWAPVITQIENSSANLILNIGNETLERRVAAKDYTDPEDKKPEVTIGEAIKIAFGCTEEDGQIYYNDMLLNESAVGFIYDEKTAQEIASQLEQMDNKKIYDVKLKRGMNIMIQKPVLYSSGDNHDETGWLGATLEWVPGGTTGRAMKLQPNQEVSTSATKLKPNTTYTLSTYAKVDSSNKNDKQKVYLEAYGQGDDGHKREKTPKKEVEIDGTKYQRIELTFKTSQYPMHFQGLFIGNTGKQPILFDDFTLVEWKTEPISEKQVREDHPVKEWMEDKKMGYVNGIQFSRVPTYQKYQYKWVVSGGNFEKDYGPYDIRNLESDKSLKINFPDYNNGFGIPVTSVIKMYAVDPISHKEYLVAKWN
ncbi:binary toxin-like calcium binding domain-containing protein [Bacillus sp. IBL03825]|uniref:binary toxin-like calcium binding domain-containing protein n=1 Tax=Bacillus sp. IBL03825 TaxID=2953580 RepID=UPI0021575037|nr:binary toxin-like calcium binding domain-containing protein [Bacillus sp. IBL03825]MCR6850436.1 PA14 domain-containing protein [Bacillus sp. IBL03825]